MKSTLQNKWFQYDFGKALIRIVVLLICANAVAADESSDALDRKLQDSIKYRQFDVFERLLSSGANPNSLFGTGGYDIAMCLATRDGFEQYLKTLVRYGADVNLFNPDSPSSGRSPLSCSIFYGNRDAFEYLLAEGADPDAITCPTCEDGYQGSPLEVALFGRKFDIAMKLIEITDVDEQELETIIFVLEKARTVADHFTNDARTELIEWVRAHGYKVNPTTPARY